MVMCASTPLSGDLSEWTIAAGQAHDGSTMEAEDKEK